MKVLLPVPQNVKMHELDVTKYPFAKAAIASRKRRELKKKDDEFNLRRCEYYRKRVISLEKDLKEKDGELNAAKKSIEELEKKNTELKLQVESREPVVASEDADGNDTQSS